MKLSTLTTLFAITTLMSLLSYAESNRQIESNLGSPKDAIRETRRNVSESALDRSTVIEAQQALINHGYDLTADGVLGPKTTAAVEKFQLERGIPQTGMLDGSTLGLLNIMTPAPTRAPASIPDNEVDTEYDKGRTPTVPPNSTLPSQDSNIPRGYNQ